MSTPSDQAGTGRRGLAPGGVSPDEEVFKRFTRKLGHDLLRYLPATIVPAVVSVLYVSIFTRMFDPVAFGRYSVVFATCTILVSILSGWVMQSVLRYLPRYREQGQLEEFKSMLAALLVALTVLVLAALVVPFAAWRHHLGEYGSYYVPAVVLVVAGIGYNVLRGVFTATLQSGMYARVEIAFAVGRLVLALAFVYGVSRSAVGLIVGPALAYVILLAPMSSWLAIPSAVARHRRDFRLALLPVFLRYGVPMVGWSIGTKVFELSDRFILEYFRGSAEVGVYSANYSLVSMGIWLVASPMLTAAHPLIVGAWEGGDQSRIQGLIAIFSRYFFLLAAPVAVFAGVFARDIAGLLLGPAFREGSVIIPIVIAGLLFWYFGFYGHKGVKLLEKTGLMLGFVTVCAAANIALNFVLVPSFGYKGAAVATLVSAVLYPIIVFLVTRRYLPWRVPWKAVGRIAAAAVVAGAVGFGVARLSAGVHPAVRLTLGAVAYMAAYVSLLCALGGLERYETALLKSWLRVKG